MWNVFRLWAIRFFKHINWMSVGHRVMKQSHLVSLGSGLWNAAFVIIVPVWYYFSSFMAFMLYSCSFIHVKSFLFYLKKEKNNDCHTKRSGTCLQHQCLLKLSVPSHLYISNPLRFTFLSPSHDGCFFCCSLEACPGFRSEVLAQTGEWAILPSSMAPPQLRWHT